MKVFLTSVIFTLVILFAEGTTNKPVKNMQSFRNRYTKAGLSPLFRKIRSPHATEQELFPAEMKPADEASEVGAKLMDEFIYFLTLKDSGLLDICLAFRK